MAASVRRAGAGILAAVVLVVAAGDAAAQRQRNNDPFGGFPGQQEGARRTQPQWNEMPAADKGKTPQADDSFFKMMAPGKTPPPLGPGSAAGKAGPGARRGAAGKPAGKAPAKGAAGAAGKGAAPGAAAQKALDPMTAADRVTATADHLARLDEAQQLLLREHFAVCDLDQNGWLSLREAEVTLALDRTEFRRTDENQDGRLDPSEFAGRKEVLLARLGARAEPVSALPPAMAQAEPVAEPLLDAPEPPPAPEPDVVAVEGGDLRHMKLPPAKLVERYDADGSQALEVAEVGVFFGEAGLLLVPDLVVDLYDRDDSGGLTVAELYPLAWMASQRLPAAALAPAPAGTAAETAATVDEAAARTLAGLTHFGRLDPDRDGFVTEAELRKLQSPARLELRLRALISGMDLDGDGRLSEAEFRASMGDPRP